MLASRVTKDDEIFTCRVEIIGGLIDAVGGSDMSGHSDISIKADRGKAAGNK